jgi:hypothetical protein
MGIIPKQAGIPAIALIRYRIVDGGRAPVWRTAKLRRQRENRQAIVHDLQQATIVPGDESGVGPWSSIEARSFAVC